MSIRLSWYLAIVDPGVPTPPEKIHPDIDFTVIKRRLEECDTVRIIVFTFENYDVLLLAVKQWPSLLEPLTNDKQYLFACGLSDAYPFTELRKANDNLYVIAIDPLTLESTGVSQ